MKLIYAQGFSKSEKLEWKPVVFQNIVQSFRLIFDAMNEMDIKFENPENEVSHVCMRAGMIDHPYLQLRNNRKIWHTLWLTTR